ncbi:MAG: MerR family transcriptional regulator [Candidatus Nanopelagicales bacterium]|jgi:DNA-binding transcriptional MerR regulator|nr:MerR family transcriptional regulator [Candidatus Nanopelagicales bacterium]
MSQESVSGTVSIGEVLSMLRREFPDVSISKIRFLEAEGLVSPQRTASGYRRYGQADIDQLRAVLTMQRDQYLPLKVIREQILEGGPDDLGPVAGTGLQASDFRPGAGRVRLTREELGEHVGLQQDFLAQLEGIGLLVATPAGHYDEDALAVASLVSRLSVFGIEARHLRPFRVVADRDTGLVEQMATPYSQNRGRDGQARERETVRELAALCIQLHAALLRAELMRLGRA